MRLLKHLWPLLLPLSLQAQLLTNNGVTITTSANVQVNGDVINNGTGLLNNDGTITITGDFTHNAANTCFGTSQGEVVMGGGAQTIGGTSVATFNDLTFTGTGAKTLQQNMEVGGAYAGPSGVLQLNDRPLIMNSHLLTVRNANANAIQRTTGYIVSETDAVAGYSNVRWMIGLPAVGTNYVIPFGNDATNSYLPFTATITATGTGVNGWISLATYPTDPTATPNNRPLPTGLTTLIDQGGVENAPNTLDRWWIMESGGYTMAPTATTQFSYRDSEWNTGTNTITEGALQLERLENAQWQMQLSIANTGANYLNTTTQALSSSIWTATMSASPLPVELISFSGERISPREVLLHWSTASEHNNAGFEVWRMIEDESDFSEIGWVDGAGDSQGLLAYAFPDEEASDKVSYYKLRQVDNDGQSEWSPIVAVNGTSTSATIVVYPNPAHDEFFIMADRSTWTSVVLIDASGRIAREWQPDVRFGLAGLPSGVYFVQATATDGSTSRERLVVE